MAATGRNPWSEVQRAEASLRAVRASPPLRDEHTRFRPRADALMRSYRGKGVSPLPDSVRQRFNLDTTFYARYADATGISAEQKGSDSF